MNYKFEITQTIFKYIEVEAENQNEAFEKISKMLEDGDVHFDNEPFLKLECNINAIN